LYAISFPENQTRKDCHDDKNKRHQGDVVHNGSAESMWGKETKVSKMVSGQGPNTNSTLYII